MSDIQTLSAEIELVSGLSATRSQTWARDYMDALRDLKAGVTVAELCGDNRDCLNRFIRWIDKIFLFRGLTTVVAVRAGTGKTHLASWIALRALFLHPEWDIYSNVPFFWIGNQELESLRPPNLYSVMSMSEMLTRTSQSIINGRVPAVILDEMDGALMSQLWRSNQNLSWERFTFIERHLMVQGPLLLYHEMSDVPHYLRKGTLANQLLSVEIYQGNRYVLSDRSGRKQLLIDGPVIPFSTYGLMGFSIDVDVGKLGAKLSATRPHVVAKQIMDNLDDCLIGYDGKPIRRETCTVDVDGESGLPWLRCTACGHVIKNSVQKGRQTQEGLRFTCSKCKTYTAYAMSHEDRENHKISEEAKRHYGL